MQRSLDRAMDLLRERPADPRVTAGYLDLLDTAEEPPATGIQALWVSSLGSRAYDRAQALMRRYALATRPQVDQLRLAPGHRVLDIGCGPGDLTAAVGQRVGPEGLAVGLDVSPTMLGIATANAADNLAFVRADATALPFRDATFDAVSTNYALQLIPDARIAVAEMARVLRPGGRLAVLIPGADDASDSWFSGLAGRLGSVTLYSAAELSDLAVDAGFTEVRGMSLGIVQAVAATRP